jgi:hypothetical protein
MAACCDGESVAAVLDIEFMPGFPEALTAASPETTGNFIRWQPR